MEQIESISGECQQVTRSESAPCLTLHQYDEGASSEDVGHTCKKHKTQHKGIFGPNSCWHRISQDSNSRLNILQIGPSTNINVCTMYNVHCTYLHMSRFLHCDDDDKIGGSADEKDIS